MGKAEKVIGRVAVNLFKGFVLEKDVKPSQDDLLNIRSVLVIIRHQMGDMLCSLPMVYSLRKAFPGAEITLVTKKSSRFLEVFEGNTNSPVNNVLLYEHGFENFIDLVKKLKDKKIDLAVVPSPVDFSATNHFIAYFADAKYRAGVRSKDYEPNRISYTLNIKNDFLWDSKNVHQVSRGLDVIRQAGIVPEVKNIQISLSSENINFAENYFSENFRGNSANVIGIHPGAAKEQNVWPAEKFAELMKLLQKKLGCSFYISEGPADRTYVARLVSVLTQKYPDIKYNIFLGELIKNAANISKTRLFVSNDTGIMHLASGFEIPVIGLFGPTNALVWGPLGTNKASVQAKNGNIDNIEITDVFETCMKLLFV